MKYVVIYLIDVNIESNSDVNENVRRRSVAGDPTFKYSVTGDMAT